ncbi:invasion regulator SirB1 [Moellerella wisconsensis]|uniref:Invasion regulator SirB1 n=1 Tax=Moellerella wisconsensis TaxID=158849 RepID=A0ACD3YAR3_9GAMM|nr:invasion regulator SirB1 [Moellerella wisconsensis]UNH40257.1 invasion regulator SirB1 [Moellerella wisconsensis]WJW83135.1 invasion regulator SirB1 [Moellerella wisconsensis]
MKSIADLEFNTVPLCEGILWVSQMIRGDFPIARVQTQLDELVELAKASLSSTADDEQQIQQLIDLFYHDWLFGSASGVYTLSDVLWLDNVLNSKQGMPASLGAIFLYIAQQLNLPIKPVIFPTQLILSVVRKDNSDWYINPQNGETLTRSLLNNWLKGSVGPLVQLADYPLEQAEHRLIIRKLFDTMKAALMEEKKMEMALKVCETLLLLEPEEPYEIRDRGLILAHLDCDHAALPDLTYFVEHCPEDPIAEMIKIQIYSLNDQPVVLH